jgi:hypothetical protein
VDTLYNLGLLHAEQGRPEEARRLWERGLALDPDESRARAALARLRCTEAARTPPLPAFAAGAAVVLGGLAQRPKLNGREGVVRGFDAAAGRCPLHCPPPDRLLAPRGQRSRRAGD